VDRCSRVTCDNHQAPVERTEPDYVGAPISDSIVGRAVDRALRMRDGRANTGSEPVARSSAAMHFTAAGSGPCHL